MARITRQPTRKTLQAHENVTKWNEILLKSVGIGSFTGKLKELVQSWPVIEDKTDLFHWTDLLNRFDDELDAILQVKIPKGKLQGSPFTAEETELVLIILHFSRILLESCSSRNIYNSYDVNRLFLCCIFHYIFSFLVETEYFVEM